VAGSNSGVAVQEVREKKPEKVIRKKYQAGS
jgi:hypothetical protein